MFKPHIGNCNNCPRTETWIVVKLGLCQYCNHERKQKNKNDSNRSRTEGSRTSRLDDDSGTRDGENKRVVEYWPNGTIKDDSLQRWSSRKMGNKTKSPNGKNGKTFQQRKKGTGEAEIFAEIAEERDWVCFVSGVRLSRLTATQFAHVLPKALNKYPLFKLHKNNIVLLSDEMHFAWDFKPRSELKKDPRFDKLFELEEQLKQEYKQLKGGTL